MNDHLYNPRCTFIKEFWRWIETQSYYRDDYSMYCDISSLMDLDVLCNNIYNPSSDDCNHMIPVPGKNPIPLVKGCKVMKVLAKIANAFNLKGFEEFRLIHSMVLNKKRFKGTLCVSIHPLDYMTMSDNDCDWDSCMSWQKPGEFREGTVETMNSSNIVVAYLKSSKDMELWHNGPTWNNKRWRELFIVQPECITGIRGYPYDDELLESEVFKMLRELMLKNKPSWAWEEEPVKINANETSVLNNGTPIKVIIQNRIMYNDYGKNQVFFPGPSLYSQIGKYSSYYINISGATEWMCCGEDWTHRSDDFNTEEVSCPECCGEYVCQNCGEFVHPEETVYFADDEDLIICRYCADRVGDVCESCYDWHHSHNINNIYMRHLGKVDEYNSVRLCHWCLDNNALESDIGPIEYKPISPRHYGNRYQVNSRNLTNRGFELFGIFDPLNISRMREENTGCEEDN